MYGSKISSLSLDMAWNIGDKVNKKELTGQLHAYWVSSRRSQRIAQMKKLVHSFCVAMGGQISKDKASDIIREKKKKKGVKDRKATVDDLMEFLQSK